MTFEEFMQENGYDLITTFWEDFSIADKYGIAGVKDTYKPGRRVSARSGGGHHRSPVESKSVRKRFANRWMS